MRTINNILEGLKPILCLFLLAMPGVGWAQSVGIGTQQPDASSILDVVSNNKGILIPRMRTFERLLIQSPSTGLLVYDINTSSFWVFKGVTEGGWAELIHADNQLWKVNGSAIFNTNNSMVGIGLKNPVMDLHIHDSTSVFTGIQFTNLPSGQTASDGFKVGMQYQGDAPANRYGMVLLEENIPLFLGTNDKTRMIISAGGNVGIGGGINSVPSELLTLDTLNPVLQFKNSGVDKGFVQILNDDIKVGTNLSNTSGMFIVRTKGIDRLHVSNLGNVGIGMSPGVQAALRISNAWEQSLPPSIQFVDDNVSTAWVTGSKNNLTLYAETGVKINMSTGGSDRLTINTNGNVGIGTYTPTSILTINASNPIIQLQHDGENKGFLQISGSNDVKIGTNLENDLGHFFIRTNGSDRVIVNNIGNMGIGTASPTVKLQVGTNGDGTVARANAWQTFSDQRYKTNIEEIPNALEKIENLHGYYYNWKTGNDETRQAGFLAQEVEKILPEVVSTDNEGYKSVDYGKMNALLLQALKEQHLQIKILEQKVEKLSKSKQ